MCTEAQGVNLREAIVQFLIVMDKYLPRFPSWVVPLVYCLGPPTISGGTTGPFFEKSAANPWSNRVVGLFVVYAHADDADSLFKTAKFQQQVDAIASEVSPYLDAIQVLVGEEKP